MEDGGVILDLSGSQILYTLDTALKIKDRTTGTTQIIDADLGDINVGLLTPSGALYYKRGASTSLFHWDSATQAAALIGDTPEHILQVKGNYAAFLFPSVYPTPDFRWLCGTPCIFNYITVMDLTTKTISSIQPCCVTSSEISQLPGNFSLATNGNIAFVGNDQGSGGASRTTGNEDVDLFRANNSNVSTLSSSGRLALTDGTNAIYLKPGSSSSLQDQLILNDGMTETVVFSENQLIRNSIGFGVSEYAARYLQNYAIENGYTIYNQTINGVFQLHRRTPIGEVEQITFNNDPAKSSAIEALADDGTVFFIYDEQRYKSTPGKPIEHMGSSEGKGIYKNGNFYLLIDSNIYTQ